MACDFHHKLDRTLNSLFQELECITYILNADVNGFLIS